MSIATAITNAQNKVANAYTAVDGKGGTMPSTQDLSNLPTAINSITELKGETKTVTPTTSQQTITPSSGKNGITQVTVNAVTSAIDSDIQAGNIKSGVSILGVNGTVTELNGETRSVSITSASGNTFTPTSGKNGITSITVTPTNQNRTVTPTTSQQTLSVNSGYSGNGTITVNAVTSSIDSDIVAGNIKSGVNILGVNGTLTPANNTSLSITPTTSAQSYTPSSPYTGYSPVSVSAVTSAIDSNIQPQFIRNGVQILGITGTYGEPLLVEVFCTDSTTWYNSSSLYGCGRNNTGQQGSGDTNNVLSFTQRASGVKQVACANNSSNGGTTWYIDNNDILYGCGRNNYGQQGSGDTNNVTSFTQRATNVRKVVCCDNESPEQSTWYIDNNDILYGCGYGYTQGSGNTTNVTTFTQRATNVKDVACSGYTTWYLTNDGKLYGCGTNGNGQQGSGTSGSGTNVLTFTQRATNVKKIACSRYTTWYLTNDGKLYGCGYNYYGQQGNGTSGSGKNVLTFTQRATNVKDVFCTQNVTWYLTNDGELYGCGYNSYGQQGNGTTTMSGGVTTFTKRADNVVQVACSSSTTWYINSSGELYGCGYNYSGQQGSGDTTNVTTFTQRATNVKDVACSGSTTWYVNEDNELYGCGSNFNGQQGNGTSGSGTDVLTFTKRN